MYFGVTHLSQFGWISQSITRFIVYSVKSHVLWFRRFFRHNLKVV